MGKDEYSLSDEELRSMSWREIEDRRWRIEAKMRVEARLQAAIRAAIEGLRGLAATK
jgi:hypothetical protein